MFKTVLVHLTGTAGDAASLAAAYAVTKLFAGHLECLHIRSDLAALISRETATDLAEDGHAWAEMIQALERESALSAQRAADALETFCAKTGIARAELPPPPAKLTAAFRETNGNALDQLIAQSRGHDLIVVRRRNAQEAGLSERELGRLITNAGCPVLLAPDVSHDEVQSVVIAWKDVPEAARAVTAAMPLLTRAKKVLIFAADEDGKVSNPDSVVAHLGWHGIHAETHQISPGDRDTAHAVLELARAAGADLLVMGAYGRNRLAELILGGFTQAVLEDASLPVLMFH